MPARKRKRRERTHDWQAIQQYTLWPEQQLYEKIRPVVLFGETAAERARETGTSERTLYHQTKLFEQEGMASLFHKQPTTSPDKGRSLPLEMRQLIVDLKAEHPGFRPHEIATICFLRFERRPSDHTVKRVLADGPKPTVTGRRYPPYTQIADPYQRRRAIVDLHAEGWSNTSISAYLQTPRHRVYEVLKRWARFGHAGLDDTPQRHARKTGIREIHEVGKLVVESPELGAYRVRAALEQIGIHLSQATCGRLLALNRKLYGLSPPKAAPPTSARRCHIARKMADAKFAQARSWEEMLAVHRSFVNDYNEQRHWAHEKREDGCHSPAQVLSWHKGTVYPESVLNRILFATRYTRHLDRHGYIRFQDWRLYGERGLAHQPVNVWVYEGTLKVEQRAVTLSRYHVELHVDRRHIQAISHPHVAETVFRSPQLTLFDLGPDEWLLYWKAPAYALRWGYAPGSNVTQLILFEVPVEAKAAGAEAALPFLRLVRAP